MPLGTRADSADSIRIQVVVVDICGLISKFSRTLPLEELLKRSLPSIYRSWQHKGAVSPFSYFKKTAGQAHTVQVPSCQCVRLPRLLLGQPKGPNNAAQPSARPERLYGRRGRGAASAVKSRQEPRIVVCRKHSSSPSRAELQSWQALDRRRTSG